MSSSLEVHGREFQPNGDLDTASTEQEPRQDEPDEPLRGNSPEVRGPSRQRKWSDEEVEAMEKTLMEFISLRKVPGKMPCQLCIQTSPAALGNRT
ncbi:hypothetical protein OJAV_G00136340 [Oryzias javanicus]|uniref:Uncharacterized protein n=1 Tax=Oryzias javanicus TaxID=123683 RepID=A0A3S2P025_ORYJA|nr:hypothetical protein OJAV_G00136340 [Oryzias javanicus]